MIRQLLKSRRHPSLRKVWAAMLCLILVQAIGTAGYMILEGWDFTDASFMTVITVASVGYGETHPLDVPGRWFTIFLILGGIGTLLYGVTNLTAFVVEGEFQALLRRSRMDTNIEKLSGHFVVCGAGRVGRNIAEELSVLGYPVVVVDRNPDHLTRLEDLPRTPLFISGDATDDEVLGRAGVERAAGFVAALATDADNLFVVLSVRQLNPSVRIIARVNDPEVTAKMTRAGADKVVCPSYIGGLRMASELVRPNVVDFLDKMLREKDGRLRVEEARVCAGGSATGKTLSEAQIPKHTGCVIVARRHPGGEFEFNPSADTRLDEGDVIVAMGEVSQVRKLKELTGEI